MPLLHLWPWVGLALAAVLVTALVLEPRPAGAPRRLDDPAFVLRWLWPVYLVHQFEEHGIDALGRPFAFLADLCGVLGHGGDLAGCPADAAFIFAVNVVACPLAFVLPILFARSRPALAAFGWSVLLVNALTHLGAAAAKGAYNPGVLTSALLFVPAGAWMLRTTLRAGVLAPRQVPLLFLTGALLHGVLIGSLLLRERGLLPYGAFLAVNAVNGLLPLLFGLAAERVGGARAAEAVGRRP